MHFKFKYKNRTFSTLAISMKGLRRGIGLMFSSKNTESRLFVFSRPSRVAITSWFVFFPFLAIWLNKNKKVIEFHVVEPFKFTLKPKKNAKYLLEVPFNEKNRKLLGNFNK